MLSLFLSTLKAIITSFKKASQFSQDQLKTSHHLLSQHQEALHLPGAHLFTLEVYTKVYNLRGLPR